MSIPTDDEMVEQIIDAVDDDRYELTEWEEDFMESVRSLLEELKPLSSRQMESLENIWEKVCQ